MKKLLCASLAILPAIVNAETLVDRDTLQHATPVTALLGETARDDDERRQGEVEDVLVTRNGDVVALLVERNIYTVDYGYEADARLDGRESYGRADIVGPTSDVENNTYVAIDASAVEYRQAADTVMIDVPPARLAEQRQAARVAPPGALYASNIVGMEVHLLDDASFGRIEDIMLSEDLSRVVAYVVDNWDGLDKERRALPVDAAYIDRAGGNVAFEYTLEQIEDVSEFNLARYTDAGWEVF